MYQNARIFRSRLENLVDDILRLARSTLTKSPSRSTPRRQSLPLIKFHHQVDTRRRTSRLVHCVPISDCYPFPRLLLFFHFPSYPVFIHPFAPLDHHPDRRPARPVTADMQPFWVHFLAVHFSPRLCMAFTSVLTLYCLHFGATRSQMTLHMRSAPSI